MAKRQCSSDSLLRCSICHDLLQNPRLLDCLHCVCFECIRKSFALNKWVVCPDCEHMTEKEDLKELAIPFHISDIRDSRQAKRKCLECDKNREPSEYCSVCGPICDTCTDSHKTMKTFKEHELSSLERKQANRPKCPHGKNLDFYCKKCLIVCCEKCTCFSKDDHECILVDTLTYDDLLASLAGLKEHGLKMEKFSGELGELMNGVSKEHKQANERIDDIWGKLLPGLEEQRKALEGKTAEIRGEKLSALREQQNKLNKLAGRIRHIDDVVQTCLLSENSASKASCFNAFINCLQKEIKVCENMPMEACTISKIEIIDSSSSLCQFLEQHIYAVSPADISKCSAIGLAMHSGTVDRVEKFTVKTAYANGRPCIEKQRVEARLLPEECIKVVSGPDQSTYEVTYTAKGRGEHELSVTVNGEHIPESPFMLTIFMNPKDEVKQLKKINNLDQPYQVAFTSKNELLVTQKGNNSIKKLRGDDHGCSASFNINLGFGTCTFKPTGIAIDKHDHLYVSSENMGCIVKTDTDGMVLCKTGEELRRPGRLYYDRRTDSIFVCERGKDQIRVYDTELKKSQIFASNIHVRCSSVTCDEDGTTYVADKNGYNIHKFDKDGKHLGKLFEDSKELSAPRGVCLQNGYMFIADRDHDRIAIVRNYSASPEIMNELVLLDQDFGSIIADAHGYIYVCNERYNYILVL